MSSAARPPRWIVAAVILVGIVSSTLAACSDDDKPASTAVSASAGASSASSLPPRDIRSIVAGRSAQEPGCAVGVADDQQSATAVFGLADLGVSRPIDEGTLFDIGSLSKQFTGGVVLDLVDNGTVTLAQTVRSWVPEVTGPAGAVTIAQLLHHRSGIPDYTGRLLQNGLAFESETTQADAIESIALAPLAFEPGSRFEYSNSNYVLLAEIAQRSTGEPFAELVGRRLLDPAGMSTAFVHDYRTTTPPMATSYEAKEGFVAQHWSWRQVGDGAIHASITDMLAWGRYLLEPQGATTRVATFLEGAEPTGDGDSSLYGAGLYTHELNGRSTVDHEGGWQGFISYFAVVPDGGLTVAALCNRFDADPKQLADAALDAWEDT